ncbi:MAG: N-acetylmuramyl-L-alanine amidase [Nitrospinaceae bacterium]
MNQSIIACGFRVDIGTRVVLWDEEGGLVCPNKRGRKDCTHHDPVLNDQPTRPHGTYQIQNPPTAYEELKKRVYQLILHYDVCYCSYQCHQLMRDSTFKGSQIYLDIDGTIYQTCDLYWKTNTGPADDRVGNERSVHVEMANLSWEALTNESELYRVKRDQYRQINGRWELTLPRAYRDKLRTPNFRAVPSRAYGERGYFSRRVNGTMVRMWDFTEEQYQALIRLCIGIHKLLPRIKLRVPYDPETRQVPLDRIKNFSRFAGILGHAHVQKGASPDLRPKYDPGSAFNWSRLRKEFLKEETRRTRASRRRRR